MKIYLIQFIKENDCGKIDSIITHKYAFSDYETARYHGQINCANKLGDTFYILEFDLTKCYNGLNGEVDQNEVD